MTGNYEYSGTNRENLHSPIEINLSEKASTVCCIFFPFFQSTLNLICSEEKKEPFRPSISEFIESE